jgi:TPP-dependent trihydroxycyclohexane-1,2-dione (THcHDO) dehydratase
MKIGDKIFCHTSFDKYHTKAIIPGNSYTIYHIEDETIKNKIKKFIFITDNNGYRKVFTLDKSDGYSYYGNYFYTEQEIRKEKLNKINESRR